MTERDRKTLKALGVEFDDDGLPTIVRLRLYIYEAAVQARARGLTDLADRLIECRDLLPDDD